MPVDRVQDIRGDYFHPGQSPDSIVRVEDWFARTIRNDIGNFQVSGKGRLGGCLVRAGAATVQVLVFDATNDGDMIDSNIVAPIATAIYDGFIGFPVRIQRGIRVSIDQADAIVTVYYKEG